MIRKYKVLDLFSGCGGMSLGFEQANFEIVLGIDNWNDALMTFQKNHKNTSILCADLSKIKPSVISEKYKNIDIIIGGPPCQGFSIAGKRIIDDERNKLYKSFVNFVKEIKPKAFVMENVPNIISMGSGIIKNNIIKDFEELGYKVEVKVLNSSLYGVPQNRKRALFVGLKNNQIFDFAKMQTATTLISSKEALSDLPKDSVNDGSENKSLILSNYQKLMRKSFNLIFNHTITNHKEKTINIISMVPDGGNYKNLPKLLQNTRKVNIAWTRLNSNKPSFTIDTGHRHHFHYLYNRVPTVRESARIQSFPDNFIFLGSKTSQYKQVGNAVPPLLAKELAIILKEYL